MSRNTKDIPIRPRYGITAGIEDLESGQELRQGSSSSGVQLSTSSYSEIPFLAQYAGDIPQNSEEIQTDKTGNSDNRNDDIKPEQRDDCPENDDDDEDEHSSRDSSKESDDLQTEHRFKMKSSHKGTMSTTGSSLSHNFMQAPIPQIDANVINDIELEAQYLGASVDNLLENLTSLLHSISSITVENVELHKNAVNKLTDSMDANIKCMYTIMAKTEEITKALKPTEKLGLRIREIKLLVDMLESTF